MRRKLSIDFGFSAGFYIWSALALLILPLRWTAAAAAAAGIHELGHLLALVICGVPVYGIVFSSDGIRMETASMNAAQELFCALAGPLGSLMLLSLIRRFPLLALCAAVQGIYNLIPVYPFDGGRVWHCILLLYCPQKVDAALNATRNVVAAVIIIAGLFCFLCLKLGLISLCASLLLIQRILPRKRPCKEGPKRVE